jgi:hypothetical protein
MLARLSQQATRRLNEEYTKAIRMAEANGDHELVRRLMTAKMG